MTNKDQLLYETVAKEIESQIQLGALRVGEKIASVREQSKLFNVSINTVLQAYVLLESRGVIESRPQSGFYVSKIVTTEEVRPESDVQTRPAPILIPDLVSDLFEAAANDKYVLLGAACLSPELHPNEAIARITRSILRTHSDVNARYEFTPGHLPLRQQIAKRLLRTGHKVSASEVTITNGALDSLHLALRAILKPGETILIESPNYFGILQSIASLGYKVIEVPANARTGVDPDDVKKILSRYKIGAAILMPNFNNPLGSVIPDTNKWELVKIFSKFGVPVIEDDIYGDLAFSGVRPKLLRAFDEEGIVISCSSFSKTISPGSRTGWALPGKFEKEFRRLQLSSTVGANRLQQYVIAEFMATGAFERYLRKIRPVLQEQLHRVSQSVLKYFPEETRFTQPQGGFMLWLELPKKFDSLELYKAAAAKKISIAPGVIFSANGNYRNYLRLNCGRLWRPEIDAAIKTLGTLAKQQL